MPLNTANGAAMTPSTKVSPFNIPLSKTSVRLLAANANRKGATIWNESSGILYIELGAVSASLTAFTAKITPGSYYELPYGYVGVISGIWDTGDDGSALIREFV